MKITTTASRASRTITVNRMGSIWANRSGGPKPSRGLIKTPALEEDGSGDRGRLSGAANPRTILFLFVDAGRELTRNRQRLVRSDQGARQFGEVPLAA